MELRRHVVSLLYRRPWLGLALGAWVVLSIFYYWWLVSRIDDLRGGRIYQPQMRFSETETEKVPNIIDVCEPIHISIVCMGKCGHKMSPMLKSLLHHRQNPLYLHFVVDSYTSKIVRKLFETWDLPDLKYMTYNAEAHLGKVSWIPNSHYSGIYSFIKLLYPLILPKSLKKVIVLDTDLTFLSDVRELWDMFRHMNETRFLGLVENESDWYMKEDRWPALGRGFNTGVMLIDLNKMRLAQWWKLWHDAVKSYIGILKKTSLGDQDIINAVIKRHPHIVYQLSCRYNVQMSTKSRAKLCYGNDTSHIKIIHWNSPRRYIINVTDAAYMRSVHHSYIDFDGNLLRQKLNRCWPVETTTEISNKSFCKPFRAAQHIKFRTYIYYLDYSYHSNDPFDVTLVLQLSIDRAAFLVRLADKWEGPISAAIYLADCDVNKFEQFVIYWSSTLSARNNIGYHLVYKQDQVHYPVNYLRNVALENVNTPYVFLMDVDFVPMDNLYSHLRTTLRLVNPYPQKKVLVVPAFETQSYRAAPPRSKPVLLARWARKGHTQNGDVAPFRAHEWPRGHRPTNYTRWATAIAPYEVEWEADYEPYLVVHNSVPKYDTRFSGFGWNKVSHIVELRALGYRAVVLPDAFVVHTTHAPSADITAFRANPDYRICLAVLKREFLEDLKRKHNFTLEVTETKDSPYHVIAENLLLNQAPGPAPGPGLGPDDGD